MGGFFSTIGIIAVVILIIYIVKKADDHCYFGNVSHKDNNGTVKSDDKVCKAARAFARDATFDEVRNILNDCIDFDEEDIEEILSLSAPHITDDDGGYRAFLKAVNIVLGKEFYQIFDN